MHRRAFGRLGFSVLLLLAGRPARAQRVAEFVPDVLPLLPVTDGVMFPNVSNEIQILAPEHKLLIEDAVKEDSLIGLVTLTPAAPTAPRGRGEIFPIGVVCVVDDVQRPADGRLYIRVRAVMRFKVISEDRTRAYRMGHLELKPETLTPADAMTLSTLREQIDELVKIVEPIVLPRRADDDHINELAFYLDIDLYERQSLLDQDGIIARARAMIELLTMKAANKR
ncbi:MAG: LON peptidase substrate-binding domain-containing protein [Vicinamibacterales bacterium]